MTWEAIAIQGAVLIVLAGITSIYAGWCRENGLGRGWYRRARIFGFIAWVLVVLAAASFIAAAWVAPWSST